MVTYKKNKFWKMLVFDFSVYGDLQKAIIAKIAEKEGDLSYKNINIIDLIISHAESTNYEEYSRIVVIYTINR